MEGIYISIVSPVYKAESLIALLIARLEESLSLISPYYEIILIEDGSPDNSWREIQNACKENEKVKGVKLSRNFGQHYAITAGLGVARGEWVVVMDCDLQDQPEEIPRLHEKALQGFDLVFARRAFRKDGVLKKFSSKVFYSAFSYLTETKQDAAVANFGIYHQKVVKAILSLGDYIRYFPTMSQWVGFKKGYLDVEHAERGDGKSSYSWKKLFQLAYNTIIAFSDKPLRLTIQLGISISLISFLIGIFYLYKYYMGDIEVLGFTSLIVSIWFLCGVIIIVLGILGVYLGKTFEQSKNRPSYIIDQELNIQIPLKSMETERLNFEGVE